MLNIVKLKINFNVWYFHNITDLIPTNLLCKLVLYNCCFHFQINTEIAFRKALKNVSEKQK